MVSKSSQRLIATARNVSSLDYLPDDDPRVLKLAMDVTSTPSVIAAFATAAKHFDGLDVVVNNAGNTLSGDTEAATDEAVHRVIETLFFGTARVTKRAVEFMR